MPGQIWEWPAWPEFTTESVKTAEDPDFIVAKKKILDRYGRDALWRGWLQVCNNLKTVTDEIEAKGNSIIPIFDTQSVLEAGGLSESQRAEAKRIGTFVFRQTVPKAETEQLYHELKQYIGDNKDTIQGWPAESPSMLILYDSPVQNTLRGHPNQLRLQRLLNGLWHDATGKTKPDPLMYHDGVRDRAPGQPFLGLGPHIDAGSLCRWVDEGYINTYSKIFQGNVNEHDCYDLSLRHLANQELFPGMAHSSVFRSFQGWTALTPTAPREGTIMVYPNVADVIAYVLLRPFFTPPSNPEDIMKAEMWELDEKTGWFPGTTKPDSQRLSRASHPHLRLEQCLVHMPKLEPGDSVWWHSDVSLSPLPSLSSTALAHEDVHVTRSSFRLITIQVCHAVDTEHLGSTNAAVAFIAACPTTAVTEAYVKRQLEATLSGKPSPDYSEGNDLDERTLKGYVGLGGLSDEAKRAFGFYL